MKRSHSQLRLIETEPDHQQEPRVAFVAQPSAPQLKALQQMRAGAKLVYRTSPTRSVHLETDKPGEWLLIHPSTAKILIAYQWVTLTNFGVKVGEYRLHESAYAFTETLCEHEHRYDEGIVTLREPGQRGTGNGERRLCKKCWGVVKSKLRLMNDER